MTATPTIGTSPSTRRTTSLLHRSAYAAALLTGAIFGIFYAWICTTMWGLDAADPRVAIGAMQSMNASVRNAVFFPAFFITPLVTGLVAVMARRTGHQRSAGHFAAAAVVYLVGGLALTMAVNVPMNEDLAATTIPASIEGAATIWDDYSGRWQTFNVLRTVASGASLMLVVIGIRTLGDNEASRVA